MYTDISIMYSNISICTLILAYIYIYTNIICTLTLVYIYMYANIGIYIDQLVQYQTHFINTNCL